MNEHLSALLLDEVAAGLAPEPAHLTDCPDCAARLERLRAQHAALLQRPEAAAQLARLAPARRSLLLPAMALAAAAAAVFIYLLPGAIPESRLKGAPSLVLLDASGASVTHGTPGQHLTLAVGAAGADTVTIFSVDGEGRREQLWSGAVDAGARVRLMEVEVTPGDVTLEAEFRIGDESYGTALHLAVP